MINVKRSPPWFTLWNEVNSCLSGTPDVTVRPLDQSMKPYVVRVEVADCNRATALASVLQSLTPYVSIQVLNAGGKSVQPVKPTSAEHLVAMMDTALSGGPLYVTTVARKITATSAGVVFPVFAKKVVQFFDDDLSDFYKSYNAVAADAFADILNPSPGGFNVSPSTANAESSCTESLKGSDGTKRWTP